jgi:hypothetical protein
MPAVRRHLGWALPLLFALAVYYVAFESMEHAPTGDQPHYALEAWSLVFDGDRDLRNDYADPERFARAFGGPPPDRHAHRYTSSPRLVSIHHVGLPVLLTPAAALSRDVRALQLEMLLVAALAALALLSVLRRVHGRNSLLLYLVWAAVAFSLPIVAFSGLLYPEIPGALLALLAVRFALARPFRRRDAVLGATCAGLMPWLHVRFTAMTVALALVLAVRCAVEAGWFRPRTVGDVIGLARTAAPALLPPLVSIGAMLVAFVFWHGSLSLSAQYKVSATPTYTLHHGYHYLFGTMFSSHLGWVTIAPIALLGLAGLVSVCWRFRAWGMLGVAVGLGYLALIGLSGVDPGYSFPWRYHVLVIPFVAIPILVAAADVRLVRLAAIPLVLLTVAFTVNGARHVADLYPQPGRVVPSLPLAKRLQSIWPNFVPNPGSGDRYPDAAQVGAIVLTLALIGGLLVPARDRRGAV